MGLRKRALRSCLLLALAWACRAPAPVPPPESTPAPPAPLPAPPPAAAEERFDPPDACLRVVAIQVSKARRRLVAECSDGVRVAFPVALSREPLGAKQRRGDWRTPEGEYRLVGEVRPSRFHRFVAIDYPSPEDIERGLSAGVIDARTAESLREARRRGLLPPQDTALGGHLGFHGEGERWRGDLDLDWTYGCIAMSDEAIDLLAERAPAGTPVRIDP